MKRSDGTRLKINDPFLEMVPYIMERRSDAQNFAKRIFFTDPIDEFIQDRKTQNIKYSYLHIFIAVELHINSLSF